jgi:Tocopherol cyclase
MAIMTSVEDPLKNTGINGVGLQVMGPRDGYICQFDRDTTKFWAARNELALGAAFTPSGRTAPAKKLVPEVPCQLIVTLYSMLSAMLQLADLGRSHYRFCLSLCGPETGCSPTLHCVL